MTSKSAMIKPDSSEMIFILNWTWKSIQQVCLRSMAKIMSTTHSVHSLWFSHAAKMFAKWFTQAKACMYVSLVSFVLDFFKYIQMNDKWILLTFFSLFFLSFVVFQHSLANLMFLCLHAFNHTDTVTPLNHQTVSKTDFFLATLRDVVGSACQVMVPETHL